MRQILKPASLAVALLLPTAHTLAQTRTPRPLPPNPLPYDLLLQHGRVIDPRNHLDGIADVGMKDGHIVAVAAHLNAADAIKSIDVARFLVTPGLIDIHGHVYASAHDSPSFAQIISLFPTTSPSATASPPSSMPAAQAGATLTTSKRASSTRAAPACSRS